MAIIARMIKICFALVFVFILDLSSNRLPEAGEGEHYEYDSLKETSPALDRRLFNFVIAKLLMNSEPLRFYTKISPFY